MASNKKRVERGVQRDYLSELADSLIIEIISLLSLDEAVRTSVLAKRWKSLWRYVSTLNFDPKKMLNLAEKDALTAKIISHHGGNEVPSTEIKTEVLPIEQRINNLLLLHQGTIASCSIIHLPYCVRYRFLKTWIKILIEKGVEDLRIIGDEIFFDAAFALFRYPKRHLDLPSEILTCTTLHTLEITHYRLRKAFPLKGAPNLHTLKLEWVYINDEMFFKVLSNCTLLENLMVNACKGLRNLKVSNQNLKYLLLQGLRVKDVYISIESLDVLVVHSLKFVKGGTIKIIAPNISVLNSYSESKLLKGYSFAGDFEGCLRTTKILENLMVSHQQGLSRSIMHGNSLQNLQQLSIDLNLNNRKEALEFSRFIRLSVNLKILEIVNKAAYDHQEVQWRRRHRSSSSLSFVWDDSNVCDCVKNNLKQVNILRFKGGMNEYKFVEFLVTEAKSLDIMSIYIHSFCWDLRETLGMTLHHLSKASRNLHIVLD